MKLRKILVLLMGCLGIVQGAVENPGVRREAARELMKEGNWKEALELWRENLAEVDDTESGKDLQAAVMCVGNLGLENYAELDALVEGAVESHGENWRLLNEAAAAYRNARHWGRLLDGEFERGSTRGGGGGIQSAERDRVRSMQLSLGALEHGGEEMLDRDRVEVMAGLAQSLTSGRTHPNTVWALALLTPLDQLPDYEVGRELSSGAGAPVAEDGHPLYFGISGSWEAARNDGERWRWLREEIRRLSPDQAMSLDLAWARFLRQHYGVGSLAGFGWWGAPRGPDESKGILQVHTLKESETLAKLANGVKRFELREDYQFIPLLRKLHEQKGGSAEAGDTLVQVFLDRRQFGQAATELTAVIARHGAGREQARTKLLNQITGDWGRLEPVQMFGAGSKPSVPFVFRNARKATCELHEIKIDAFVADIFAHLESNPKELDWNQTNVGSIGQLLVNEGRKKYLGKRLAGWEVDLDPRSGHWDTRTDIEVPTAKAGAYLLKARAGDGNEAWLVVWISDTVLLSHQTKDEIIYFLGDGTAGRPLSGEVEFFGYRSEQRKGAERVLKKFDVFTSRFTRKVGDDGLLRLPREAFDGGFRWMAVARSEGGRRALMGFNYQRWHDYHWPEHRTERSYGITDRPVYRPGQTVKIKFWSRAARYDLADESLFAGRECQVEIYGSGGARVHEARNLRADEFGGVELEFEIPDEARLGQYAVRLSGEVPHGQVIFRVEEYKKPEYEVTVDGPKEPVQLGEKIEATVKATYYHGAPVTEARVKVKVQRYSHSERWFPEGRWDWLYGKGYWWFGESYEWYPGWRGWGCEPPVPAWWGGSRWTPPELVMEREYDIGMDGTVKVLIDTEIAKLVHGDIDHRYEVTAEVVDASRRTIVGTGSVLAARQPFEVTTWLDRGYARPGEPVTLSFAAKTLDGRGVEASGKGRLYRISTGEDGGIKEELVNAIELNSDSNGEGKWTFEAPERGQYRLSVTLTDEKGNSEEGAVVFVVRGEKDDGQGLHFNDLELILDKKHYAPGDTARILVNANQPEATVLLFLRGSGRVAEQLELLKIDGKSREFLLPLEKRDMPNTFVEAVTITRGRVVSEVREIVLPPEKRLLTVEVLPGKTTYKPREKGTVTIRLTDENGEPFVGTTAVTVYDKSLEYVAGGSNVPDIRSYFWNWKRGYSRGALRHSQGIGSGQISKRGKSQMKNLGRFGRMVADTVTAGLAVNEMAEEAQGRVMSARKVAAPIELSAGLSLSADDGGGGEAPRNGPEVMVRSEFADLLKWAGSVMTNERGEAQIELEMPDNLTTWKIKTWGIGHGTRVGEGSAEFMTSKDLIVRLQSPRFFIEGDRVTLSAVVHNYHEEPKEVRVSLELDGGTVVAEGAQESSVVIPAGGERRIDWTAVARREGEITIRMKALAKDDGDAMEMKFPVHVHGMARTESWSRAIAPEGNATTIKVIVPEKRRPNETRLEIRYSPTIATAMVDALPYLANYPYGCTEQTLNRFVPSVITQKLLEDMDVDLAAVKNKRVNLNPQEIGDPAQRAAQWKRWKENPVWDKDEVDKMVRAGVKRLRELQNSDGGWGWFSNWGEHSYPHTTAVVVNGLVLAKANGAAIPGDMLERGVSWLKRHEETEAEKIRMWDQRKRNTRRSAGAMDAMVREVLGKAGAGHEEMLAFLFRDKVGLPVYAKCLLGLELHRVKRIEDRDAVLRNIEQFLKKDPENQTAYLDLQNGAYWWYWYGSDFEAHASYLKLLAAVKPDSEEARGLVKYLVNNRKHASYWNSTRDTAYCIEALADYLRASGESAPDLEVEVLLDGKTLKTVRISKENLFSFDGTAVIAGDILGTGEHVVELRKNGSGPLYANAYLTVFTLEDFITKAGLEVKVERNYYKLVPSNANQNVAGSRGQALTQKKEKYQRIRVKSGDQLVSGDLIEVELSIESKNDYSYLIFEDWKAAGLEPVEVRSGHNRNGLGAYMELRDEKVALFVRSLPRGRHNLSYRLRAEIPGEFSALPTRAEAMYAPELKANSDEMKVRVRDK